MSEVKFPGYCESCERDCNPYCWDHCCPVLYKAKGVKENFCKHVHPKGSLGCALHDGYCKFTVHADPISGEIEIFHPDQCEDYEVG